MCMLDDTLFVLDIIESLMASGNNPKRNGDLIVRGYYIQSKALKHVQKG
jgi:hypothetical protein